VRKHNRSPGIANNVMLCTLIAKDNLVGFFDNSAICLREAGAGSSNLLTPTNDFNQLEKNTRGYQPPGFFVSPQ